VFLYLVLVGIGIGIGIGISIGSVVNENDYSGMNIDSG
jgi:hypothetical protein